MYIFQWPPPNINETWKVDIVIPFCRNKTGVDPQMVRDFSDGEDFDKLPNDDKFKEYLLCQAIEFGVMKEGSPQLHVEGLLDYINSLEPYHQDIYFGFNKKCMNKIKEPKEKVYQMNVCHKKNDVVVSMPRALFQIDSFMPNFVLFFPALYGLLR